MELISGIWLLDILNILKYNGVDIFDSIVNIGAGTWCILLTCTFCLYLAIGLISSMVD